MTYVMKFFTRAEKFAGLRRVPQQLSIAAYGLNTLFRSVFRQRKGFAMVVRAEVTAAVNARMEA